MVAVGVTAWAVGFTFYGIATSTYEFYDRAGDLGIYLMVGGVAAAVIGGEVARRSAAHRVHEVVGHLRPGERFVEPGARQHVAAHDPHAVRQAGAGRVADEACDVVSGARQQREQAAADRFADFAQAWGGRYPAIVRLWENAWAEFVPFLEYDVEIRRVICTTNAIESINARYRRAVNARGYFPTEAAAMKCLYMTTRSLDPTGNGKARWVVRWKPALNAFAITFAGRFERTTH